MGASSWKKSTDVWQARTCQAAGGSFRPKYHFDSKHTGLIDSRSSVRSTKDQGYAGLMKEAVGSGRLVHMHSPSFYDDDQSSDRLS